MVHFDLWGKYSLLWTSKSTRNIASELTKNNNITISHVTVAELLSQNGYSLQANRKDLAIQPKHPDRNAQFEYINKQAALFLNKNAPVLSIDTKKKENVGNFKNNGKTYCKKATPLKVLDHDFFLKKLGKAVPYGVYDVFKNTGFVSVGISCDTAEFAVASLRKWWYRSGKAVYGGCGEVLVTCDCGGSNGYRVRLWKAQVQLLANEIGKKIMVLHFPPGTSKWNKIEHRLFSFISKNWQGLPLVSMAVIVSLIGSTKTSQGLSVDCVVDNSVYVCGVKVEDAVFAAINIEAHKFHGEWNYIRACSH